ncbi:beta-ketoacyl-[acyl-carrier-protein] synthase family protein [Streptococcus gallolyticus subsp. gallolyticus]|uniref:beta-ketoacyl-[acyl-carrier-protein] synthase family protein n=1 Tax=Streptococcus gallolyticus TaxID=315405 RepID=UPI0022848555|nr:beta-ketoacyl-[acyl-carrier-protein] synthase family protein [Streptococcus gallolyticus]MCY7172667.1 beta-ketoacyl-[acyl-carrier-protein] synthase family protein [Streptococcus gallolyticus subsp. gallolyticus]
MKNRVVITGMGIISSLGLSVDQWWKNLLAGKSAIHFSDKYDEWNINPVTRLADIKNFNFNESFPQFRKYSPYLDRGMKFGIAAAMQAYLDSNIGGYNSNIGVYVGTTTGGIDSAYSEGVNYVKSNSIEDNHLVYKFSPSSWASLIAHCIKSNGPTKVVGTSCYAGGESIGIAYRNIKAGKVQCALAGGLDAPIVLTNYLSFKNIGAVSSYNGNNAEKSCSPFSEDRSGMVFGEGSAFFVMESLENALKRNAKIYGEIIGYATTSDGENMVHPSTEGSRWSDAINLALKEAEISASQISFVSCHGTGTILNDRAEMRAINNSLNKEIRIGSIKSMIGHSFGGATALEIAHLIKSLETGWLPPTINFKGFKENEGGRCIVQTEKEYFPCDYVLKTATGFGGSNLAMVLSKWRNNHE